MNYLKKAEKLVESGFWVAGTGHFNISIKELATILSLVEKEDFSKIKELYKKLSEERL